MPSRFSKLVDPSRTINLAELSFQLTGKYKATPPGTKSGPGLTYIPPLNLNMQNHAPQKLFTGAQLREAESLPESFSWINDDDVRKYKGDEFVGVVMKPKNQHMCGSCWAFSTSGALSDRVSIATKRKNPDLGPTQILAYSISPESKSDKFTGCGGGIIAASLEAMSTEAGSTSTSCDDYKWCSDSEECTKGGGEDPAALNSLIPPYSNHCNDSGSQFALYKVRKGSVAALGTIDQIKHSIFTKGPLPTGYYVYMDFFLGTAAGADKWAPTGGIYVHIESDEKGVTKSGDTIPYSYEGGAEAMNTQAGAHAVVIVGWGVDEVANFLPKSFPGQKTIRLPYWIVRNSWGSEWNDGGFFKIAMTDAAHGINTIIKFDDSSDGLGGPVDFEADTSGPSPGPGPGPSPSPTPSLEKKSHGLWRWIFIILGIAVLIALIYFIRKSLRD
jgi:hypothetical protein